MTGQLTHTAAPQAPADHVHITMNLDSGAVLQFRDVRRFGSFDWFATMTAMQTFVEDKLGPEPWATTPTGFHTAIQKSQRTLKALLLDQAVVAGVGNIYADEALHRCRLHPQTRGVHLSDAACEELRVAIIAVMDRAISLRGSTIRDYIGGSGLRGGFQNEFTVYGRTGEACLQCGTTIEALRVAGRSSHICPKCQVQHC
jgi:formamidopyrimidine-DNA glycosylase